MLGTTGNTVSRYELGQMLPSRSVMIVLLQYAGEREREELRNLLDGVGVDVSEAQLDDVQRALDRFEEFAARGQSGRKPNARVALALAALEILSAPNEPLGLALADFLQSWLRYRNLPGAGRIFDKAAAWLETELRMLELSQEQTDRGTSPAFRPTEAPAQYPQLQPIGDHFGHGRPAPKRMYKFLPPVELESRAEAPKFSKRDPRYMSEVRWVAIECPERRKPLFTGFQITQHHWEDTPISSQQVMCPYCHSIHHWGTKDGWLAVPVLS